MLYCFSSLLVRLGDNSPFLLIEYVILVIKYCVLPSTITIGILTNLLIASFVASSILIPLALAICVAVILISDFTASLSANLARTKLSNICPALSIIF